MFPPSIFEERCVGPSKIDDQCVDLRRSMIDVSTFENQCVDLRGSICGPSLVPQTLILENRVW